MGPSLEEADLRALEAVVERALADDDDSALTVLGYGEVSVALGWPVEDPEWVCKRTPPFTRTQFSEYRSLVFEYIQELTTAGLRVADTAIMGLERGPDEVIAYLVQPLLDAETLGHNILRVSEPDADHPFLAALFDTLDVVTATCSLDAQAGNFGWDGSNLTLVDVGTPFLWDRDGNGRFDMVPFARMLPAPLRPVAIRELTKLVTRWNDPRRVGLDVIANLYRDGLPEWVDPAVVALNRKLESSHPAVTADDARALYEEDLKIWPLLKKAQRVERWWQNSVRRRSYDWFIRSSFD